MTENLVVRLYFLYKFAVWFTPLQKCHLRTTEELLLQTKSTLEHHKEMERDFPETARILNINRLTACVIIRRQKTARKREGAR